MDYFYAFYRLHNDEYTKYSPLKNFIYRACQRARKAIWQRYKMKTDVDYRAQQQLSNEKWVNKTPGYWTRYRQRNPDKVERNRALQHIRNRRNRQTDQDPAFAVIAKMDARKSYDFDLLGQFYLVPVIAKMDVSKVNIYIISKGYHGLQRWT